MEYVDKMKPFFLLDPLLLPLFVGICPTTERDKLIDHIPLFMFTLWMQRRFFEDVECIGQTEVNKATCK